MTYYEMTDEQRIEEFAKVGVKIGTKVELANGEVGIVTDIDYEGGWVRAESDGRFITKCHPWSFSGINAARIIRK